MYYFITSAVVYLLLLVFTFGLLIPLMNETHEELDFWNELLRAGPATTFGALGAIAGVGLILSVFWPATLFFIVVGLLSFYAKSNRSTKRFRYKLRAIFYPESFKHEDDNGNTNYKI